MKGFVPALFRKRAGLQNLYPALILLLSHQAKCGVLVFINKLLNCVQKFV